MEELHHYALKVEEKLKKKAPTQRNSFNFICQGPTTTPPVPSQPKRSASMKIARFKCGQTGHMASSCLLHKTVIAIVEEDGEEESGEEPKIPRVNIEGDMEGAFVFDNQF